MRGDRPSDQSSPVWSEHDKRDLQGQVGDRTLLQDAEAESEGENLRRRERKGSSHSDLDSPDLLADDQVAPSSLESGMVLREHGDHASAEPLHVSSFAGLAQRTV